MILNMAKRLAQKLGLSCRSSYSTIRCSRWDECAGAGVDECVDITGNDGKP
jgi:hypothetical protein